MFREDLRLEHSSLDQIKQVTRGFSIREKHGRTGVRYEKGEKRRDETRCPLPRDNRRSWVEGTTFQRRTETGFTPGSSSDLPSPSLPPPWREITGDTKSRYWNFHRLKEGSISKLPGREDEFRSNLDDLNQIFKIREENREVGIPITKGRQQSKIYGVQGNRGVWGGIQRGRNFREINLVNPHLRQKTDQGQTMLWVTDFTRDLVSSRNYLQTPYLRVWKVSTVEYSRNVFDTFYYNNGKCLIFCDFESLHLRVWTRCLKIPSRCEGMTWDLLDIEVRRGTSLEMYDDERHVSDSQVSAVGPHPSCPGLRPPHLFLSFCEPLSEPYLSLWTQV